MGVVLYHVFAVDGELDEFTEDFDEAIKIFERTVQSHDDVHLHVEEYASRSDYEDDRMAEEECLQSTGEADDTSGLLTWLKPVETNA